VILLDTDHFNILQIGRGPLFDKLSAHMDATSDQQFAVSVVTFEEHMRGWLARIRRAQSIDDEVKPYDQLIKLVRFFQAWEIVRFDEGAAARFRDLRHGRIRIGTLDLKIASIALEHSATLLTANTRDFEQVPGLNVEDWLH
jgi:tRNA(fMet)-specific endonuclease VapC